MSDELMPCPFCGQQDAFVEQLDSDASVVICQGMVDEHSACLARGPVGLQQSEMEDQPGKDAAIAEWNRRAQPAALSAVTAERDRLRAEVNSLLDAITAMAEARDQLRAKVEALRKALEQFADDGNWCYDTCNIGRDVAKDALVAKDETP